MIKHNTIYNENCIETMAKMPDNIIDLTITSPPYDNLRDYNGYAFDIEIIAKELFRITKEGGVLVWIVSDQTIKGSETLSSFKQAISFRKAGFNLHDTMIWFKPNPSPTDPKTNRYYNSFEYMFVFSKGKPKTCNYIKIKSKSAGKLLRAVPQKRKDGSPRVDRMEKIQDMKIKEFKIKHNVWEYATGNISKDKIAYKHPAIFPERLVEDHIKSWSNEEDIVYDPFMGSGTTAKMAILNNRNFIGSEISREYCDIANERLSKYTDDKSVLKNAA